MLCSFKLSAGPLYRRVPTYISVLDCWAAGYLFCEEGQTQQLFLRLCLTPATHVHTFFFKGENM